MNNDSNYIDFNQPYNYVLQWLYESESARNKYQLDCRKVDLAFVGKPSRNYYQEDLNSNIDAVADGAVRESYRKACVNAPVGESFVMHQAVMNRASQIAGGVDSYECVLDDPYMIADPQSADLIAAMCEHDYIRSNLGSKAPIFSQDLTKYGMTVALVRYDKEEDRNIITRIHPKNCWVDTKYSVDGSERFRAYSTMISFNSLVDIIKKDGDKVNTRLSAYDRSIFDGDGKIDNVSTYDKKTIRTLNGLRFYVQDLNRLAGSTELETALGSFPEYQHDLQTCYNSGYYRSLANDAEAKTKTGYEGDDVELTVLYDLNRKIEFKIINRRFVISANEKAFRRKINVEIDNPVRNSVKDKLIDFKLECPLKFRFEDQAFNSMSPYPISVAMLLQDQHDRLCSWRAMRRHVSLILSILRIATNAADAQSLKGRINIMGVVLDDIQGDIGTIDFAYDYSRIDSEIAYIEDTIIKTMHAYNEFDAMQAMGDRASASESGLAGSAIANGLTIHQKTVMDMYADIARQCIANRVVYSDKDEFSVFNAGDYSELTIKELTTLAVVNVKSKLAKKSSDKMLATNALAILGSVQGQNLPPEARSFLFTQALYGQVPRKLAAQFGGVKTMSESVVKANTLEAENMANMLKQNQQMYEANPSQYEIANMVNQLDNDELDQVISNMAVNNSNTPEMPIEMPAELNSAEVQALEMPAQEGAISAGFDMMTPEMGSMLANPNGY